MILFLNLTFRASWGNGSVGRRRGAFSPGLGVPVLTVKRGEFDIVKDLKRVHRSIVKFMYINKSGTDQAPLMYS